jgi:hypothetical protein
MQSQSPHQDIHLEGPQKDPLKWSQCNLPIWQQYLFAKTRIVYSCMS